MFKKSERLTRAQFDTYFQTGKRHHADTMTLIHTPLDTRHIAVVVGKKVARKAHDRNTLRRRIYGKAYQQLRDETGVFIFLTKPNFASLTKAKQREAVQNLLKRITLSS